MKRMQEYAVIMVSPPKRPIMGRRTLSRCDLGMTAKPEDYTEVFQAFRRGILQRDTAGFP